MSYATAQQPISRAEIADTEPLADCFVSRQALLSDPSLFLWRVDLRGRRFVFLKVSPRTFRESMFLDDRIVHDQHQVLSVAIDDVLR